MGGWKTTLTTGARCSRVPSTFRVNVRVFTCRPRRERGRGNARGQDRGRGSTARETKRSGRERSRARTSPNAERSGTKTQRLVWIETRTPTEGTQSVERRCRCACVLRRLRAGRFGRSSPRRSLRDPSLPTHPETERRRFIASATRVSTALRRSTRPAVPPLECLSRSEEPSHLTRAKKQTG